ncbi:MAG: rod shape-determining protein MreC [Elusimicrobiota bacterium]
MNRDKRVANYLLLTFSVLSIVLLCLPLTGKVRAFHACAAYLLDPIPFLGSRGVERLVHLPARAARLISADIRLQEARTELKEAALVRAEAESLRREIERLRTAVGIKPAGGRVVRWARVMERDPLNWHRSVMVDAGSEDGVRINAPVLGLRAPGASGGGRSDGSVSADGSVGAELGVVGRVTAVGARVSTVRLITDELSAVAAYLPAEAWEGLIQGQGGFRLRMDYLPVEAQFSMGETVYTSPTSATFPQDIPIGTISREFKQDPFLAFKSLEVTPTVSASKLREVMILEPAIEEAR